MNIVEYISSKFKFVIFVSLDVFISTLNHRHVIYHKVQKLILILFL